MSNSTRRARLPRPTTLALAVAALSCLPAHAQTGAPASMPEVVVSASGFEQDSKRRPPRAQCVTRQELSRSASATYAGAGKRGRLDVGAAGDKTGGMNISIRGSPATTPWC